MRRWADARPDYQWAPYPPGPPFLIEDRVAALHDAVMADPEPAVLIAHSAGCFATVVWASRHTGPVQAALLVTPPCFHPDWKPEPGAEAEAWQLPRDRLPFRTIVVASRNDPRTTFGQFEQYAADWGSELVDAGEAGHIETASGYGPWPAGEHLVDKLTHGTG
jgi:serine hydrolase